MTFESVNQKHRMNLYKNSRLLILSFILTITIYTSSSSSLPPSAISSSSSSTSSLSWKPSSTGAKHHDHNRRNIPRTYGITDQKVYGQVDICTIKEAEKTYLPIFNLRCVYVNVYHPSVEDSSTLRPIAQIRTLGPIS